MRNRRIESHLSARLAKGLDPEGVSTSVAFAERRRLQTLEALVEVDRGRILEHEEIEDWLAELEKRKGASR